MSAATSPGTGLAYGLRRVCAAWGMARSSFYAMTSGQHAEQPPGKASGTEARDLGPGAAGGDRSRPGGIVPGRAEGYRKVWARLRVCRDIRVARKRVLRLMRENNLLSPLRCRRRGGNPHDGEIITHAPNLMWGTDGVRVFTVDDGWGCIFTAVEHWNAECVGWHVCKPATASPPCSRSPWGLPGCMARPRPARLGGWPCGWITAPSICRPLHQPDQVLGHPAVLRLRRRAPDQRRRRAVQSHAEGQIIHGRIYRNIASCGTPSATSSNSTMPSGSSKRTAT